MEVGGASREVAGASVTGELVPLVGRRFWVYEGPLETRAINEVFDALATDFDPSGSGPIGLAVMVGDREAMERHPEPLWPGTELIFAGYLPDDRQLRIRYFWGAAIGPGLPDSPTLDQTRDRDYGLESEYRLERLAESEEVGVDDVLAFWEREGAVAGTEAHRRVHEVELVAIRGDGGLAGVASIYLQRNEQLRMDLWYYRTFIGEADRHSNLAAQLLFTTRDRLERSFTGGEDRRAGGMIFELENEGMMRRRNKALWLHAGFTFIGENRHGHHVRVRYFPGATVPLPRRA